MRKFIANGHKLISRLDRDIGVLIDNCLGFLYSMDLAHDLSWQISQIEAELYDMVYLGRTKAGYEFKETLFRTQILPIMKRLAPAGYYFGIDPENNGLLGYWRKTGTLADHPPHRAMAAAEDRQTTLVDAAAAD